MYIKKFLFRGAHCSILYIHFLLSYFWMFENILSKLTSFWVYVFSMWNTCKSAGELIEPVDMAQFGFSLWQVSIFFLVLIITSITMKQFLNRQGKLHFKLIYKCGLSYTVIINQGLIISQNKGLWWKSTSLHIFCTNRVKLLFNKMFC